MFREIGLITSFECFHSFTENPARPVRVVSLCLEELADEPSVKVAYGRFDALPFAEDAADSRIGVVAIEIALHRDGGRLPGLIRQLRHVRSLHCRGHSPETRRRTSTSSVSSLFRSSAEA